MAQDIFGNFTEAVRNAIMQLVRVGVVGRANADGTTTIVVPGRDHYIYVRTGATQTGGEMLEAYNKGIPRLAGAPVLLVKWNRVWTVIGVDADSPAVTPTTYSVAYHVHERDNGLAQSINDLEGMPSTLAGRAGALLRVNDDEDGYYLADAASGGTGTVDSVNGAVGAVIIDADDIAETASRIWFTTAEETKLAGIEALADVTDAGNIASSITGVATDDTIADADVWGYLTGGVLVKTAWSNIKAVLKTYFDTLYVALTGNQTVGGVKTFSDGIAFANETMSVYDEGTYSPALQGSGGDPTITYSVQNGYYTQIGRVVFYHAVVIINTTSGGSGDLRLSLPHTATIGGIGNAYMSGVASITGVSLTVNATDGQAYSSFQRMQDSAGAIPVPISGIGNGDVIAASGWYFR